MPIDKAPDGLPYGPSAGGPPLPPRFGQGSQGQPGGAMSLAGGPAAGFDGDSVMGQGSIAPMDQFALGRDMANLSQVDPIKAKSGPNWGRVGQAVSAGLAGYLAAQGNPAGLAMMQQNFLMQREKAEARNRQELERIKAGLPQQVGDSLVVPDGMGGFKTVFRDAQPFEAYAESLGYQPGSPEYMEAIQNYRLGSWSDPALEAKQVLEGVRYGHRDALQDDRLTVTKRGQDIRSTDTRRGQDITRGNNIRSTSTSAANNARSNETQRGAYSYTHGSGRGKGAGGDGQIIVNPTTGQRMQLKGGQWVPIK